MANLITKNSYYNYEDLVIESVRTDRMTVKSGEGVIVKGQVFDFDATSLKLVKHVAGNDIVAVALEGIDATSSDANVQVLIEGTVNSFKLVGIDYVSDIAGLKSMYAQGLYAEEIITGYVR